MHIKITGGSKGVYANQASCTGLVNYLQHEDLDRLKKGQSPEFFFDQERDQVRGQEVVRRIDANKGQLGKADAKFYSVILSPSVKELQHLGASREEQSARLKAYIREEVLPAYAAGFDKGLGAGDILYYGKVHYERGEKTDDQLHVHLVISRKDQSNTKKLSPMTNHRGTTSGAVKGGFNREAFVGAVESGFDRGTGYQRDISESFAYLHGLKSGDISAVRDLAMKRVAQEKKARQEAQKIDPKQQKEERVQERIGRGPKR